MGYSWGALLAMLYAVQHPQHIERLILLSPAPPTAAVRKEYQQRMADAMHRPEVQKLREEFAQKKDTLSPEEQRRYRFALAVTPYFLSPRRALELTPFLVKQRLEEAIWKSLVLPAGGAALCWLLLMTLWMPLLDFARSYTPVVNNVVRLIDKPGCVEVHGLSRGHVAAFRYHGQLALQPVGVAAACPWLIVGAASVESLAAGLDMRQWTLLATVRRPADANDNVLLYQRASR